MIIPFFSSSFIIGGFVTLSECGTPVRMYNNKLVIISFIIFLLATYIEWYHFIHLRMYKQSIIA